MTDATHGPRVSVIVPNYNHARYLPHRLQSVFGQTYRDVEVLLLDDASTDGSRDILSGYRDRPGVQLLFNEKNSGSPFRQWNKGVRLARGAYVWIAESDDVADSRLLERLVSVLDRNSRVGIAYCMPMVIGEDGSPQASYLERLESVDRDLWRQDFVMDGREFLRQYQVVMNCVPNASGVLFRRDVFLAAGGAAEHLHLAGDWMTWSRMLLHGDVAFVAETLNHFRTHERTVRSDWLTHQTFALEYASVIRFVCGSVDVPAESRQKAIEKLHARWRRVVRGFTLPGVLRLCLDAWAIGGLRSVGPFLRAGMAGMGRTRPVLQPLYRAGKAVLRARRS